MHAIIRFLPLVTFLICQSLALPAFAQPAQPTPSESGLSLNEERFVTDLLMVTYDPTSGWCVVEFMSHQPMTRAICNFDIGKLQTVQALTTPGAVVYPMIFAHTILNEQTIKHLVEDGQRDKTGRMSSWPPLEKLPDPAGPAFVSLAPLTRTVASAIFVIQKRRWRKWLNRMSAHSQIETIADRWTAR